MSEDPVMARQAELSAQVQAGAARLAAALVRACRANRRYLCAESMPDVRMICPHCNSVYVGSGEDNGRLVLCCANYHVWSGE